MAIARLSAAVAAVSILLMGGCALLLASAARAETNTLLATNGQWSVRQYSFDNGSRACMMSSHFPTIGVRVAVEAVSGEQRLRLVMVSTAWHTTSSFKTRFEFRFDGDAPWGSDDNGVVDKDYVVTWINQPSMPAFVHAFTSQSTMQITALGLGPLPVSLTGTTAGWGAFMDCAKIASPAIVAAISGMAPPIVAAAPSPPAAPVVQPASTQVALVTRSGVKHVEGIAGRGTPVLFILDSGAGDVQLPRASALQLIEEGSLVPTGKTEAFTDATGKDTPHMLYTLRSLTVGSRTVTNVECIVTDKGDALLGQSFLGRLGSWSINNTRQTLVLG